MKLKRSQPREQREDVGETEQRRRNQHNSGHYKHQNDRFFMQRTHGDDQTGAYQRSSSHEIYAPAFGNKSREDQHQHQPMHAPSDAAQKPKRKPVGGGQPMMTLGHHRQQTPGFSNDVREDDSGRTIDALSTTRRKKRRSSRQKYRNECAIPSRSSFGTDTDLVYLRPPPDLWSWRDYLPQSMDDTTIVDRVQQIFVLAEQYVNNFYVDCNGRQAQMVPFFEREGLSSSLNDVKTECLMFSVTHPTILIKHSLIASLLDVISLEPQHHWTSLLPAEFLSMTRAIDRSDLADNESPHWNAALSAYRVLSHYIRKNVTQDPHYIKSRNKSIDDIVSDIEITFAPWESDERTVEQRGPILCALFEEAADLGIALFSQASTFHFSWPLKATKSGAVEIAIAPRLYKLYDENAQLIDKPQQMTRLKVEKTVKRIHISKPLPLPTTRPANRTVQSPMPSREVRSPAASEACQQNLAELPAETTRADALIENDSNENSHDPFATIRGPSLNEPDYENANGEGLSLAAPLVLRDGVTPSQFHTSDGRGLPGTQRRKRSASIGDLDVHNLPYLSHKLNEFVAVSQERIRLPHRPANDDSACAVPAISGNNYTRRKLLPPNSFPTQLVENTLVRRESLGRGRKTSQSSFLGNRSRSESRAICGLSDSRHPLAGPAEMDALKLQPHPINPAEQYVETRAIHGRAREDRDTVATKHLPIPDGSLSGLEKVVDTSGIPRMDTTCGQTQGAMVLTNAPKLLHTPEMGRTASKPYQNSNVSGWLKSVLVTIKGDSNRHQQRVIPM